jgi:hypothetical protein
MNSKENKLEGWKVMKKKSSGGFGHKRKNWEKN